MFYAGDQSRKDSWKCFVCLQEKPKHSTSDNAPREQACVAAGTPALSLHQDGSFVTKRCVNLPTDNSKEKMQIHSPTSLSKEDIRDLLRQEFSIARESLVMELQQTLKDMVRSELKNIKDDVSALENSVQFISKEFDSAKTDMSMQINYVCDVQSQNKVLTETVND
ncbi:hypothetical protein O0L34_g19243 [Tuta absoluta]|nr:hypothetical protein O0L34_g19243 [Tuta absoluta]